MEPLVEKLKGIAKTTQEITNGIIHRFDSSHRRSPIQILKRLQREAFSDIMKLRDRQDKVERLLSFYKLSKGSNEAGTRVRGEVEALGLLLMIDRIHKENQDAIQQAGIRNGINSRFTFETTIREKDTLIAEFVACDKRRFDTLAGPLSLAKVVYSANINDWFSLVGIPVGGRCRDVGPAVNPHQEDLTNYSCRGPPLLNQHTGSGIGVTVRKPNIVASLAQFVSTLGMQLDSSGTTHCLSTFGQIVYQLSNSTKLLLLGLHQVPKSSNSHIYLGEMAFPIGMFRHRMVPEFPVEASEVSTGTSGRENMSFGSMALMLESELDESTRIGGWVEMNRSSTRHLQWAVSMSDIPEDDFGWGLSMGGLVLGPKILDHFQAEAFLKFNFGQKFSLQPAVVYMMDGTTQFPALMLKSSWSL